MMNVLNSAFYPIFLVVVLEIIKTAKRELKKSKAIFTTQLAILSLSFLIIITYTYAVNKIFVLIPVLIAIPVVADWVGGGDIKVMTSRLILLKFLLAFYLISIGIAFSVYGLART